MRNMAPNAVLQIWHRYWPLTVDIILQKTPKPKVAGGEIWQTGRPCHQKKTVDHLCMHEVLFQQLLYSSTDMSRCTILPENDVFKAYTLLKLQKYEILQHIIILMLYDKTDLDSICSYLFKKIQSNNKEGRKTTQQCHFFRMQSFFLDSMRVFPCPNSKVLTYPLKKK